MKYRNSIVLGALLLFLLTGCTPGDSKYLSEPAGFLWGFWHGLIAPITLIIGIFKDTVHMYEINNTGWFYDLGFYLALANSLNGARVVVKKDKKKK